MRQIAAVGAAVTIWLSLSAGAARGAEPAAINHKVEASFNREPFVYQEKLLEERKGLRILRLTFPSPVKTEVEANNTVPADYYLPAGAEKGPRRPAVLVLHILNGNFELERLLCLSLAARGIPAVMIKLPYYGERAIPGGRAELAKRPDLFAAALPQGILDARRTLDVLASRPEVDPAKMGVTGISLGGIISATTAASDPRVHRAVLLLAGGDLLSIIHHARETRPISEFIKAQSPADRVKYDADIARVDPLTRAADLRDRAKAGRVLMLNAREDDVIPPAATNKLADALGIRDQVVWFEGLGHYTAIAALPQTFQRTVEFFAQDLPKDVGRPVADEPPPGSPTQVLATIAREALAMVTDEPKPGCCHLVDLSATVTERGGKEHQGELRLVRGAGHKFRIQFKLPPLGEGMWGQSDAPWMASAKNVFQGSKPGDSLDALQFAEAKHVAKFRTLAAGAAGLLLLPGILEQSLVVRDEPIDGRPGIVVRLKDEKKQEDSIQIGLDGDRRPTRARFAIGGTKGEITIRAWQVNTVAPEELFQPPADRPNRSVEAADLYRIFGATFNFALEMAP